MLVPSLRRPVPPRAAGANDGALEIGGETFNLSADAQNVLAHLMHADAASFAEILAAFAGSLDEAALRKSVLDLARQGLLGLEPGRDS
jgi:hypothetical protein